MFQTHLALSLPYSRNEVFLQEALVPFSEERFLETKVWALGMFIAT